MKNKNFNVFVCKMTIEALNVNRKLKENEMIGFLNDIKSLPIDLSIGEKSRYKKDKSCLIFVDELKNAFEPSKYLLPALFIKRRENKPLEDDGHGNLQSITLSSEENQIAEVCYVIFSLKNSLIYWITNPIVGGISSFADYLSSNYIKSCGIMGKTNHLLENGGRIVFNYVKYPNTHSDYIKDSFQPVALDFNLALSNEELLQGDLFTEGDGSFIKLLQHLYNNSNCGRIHLELTAPRYKKKKDGSNPRPYLNKLSISNFFADIKDYLRDKDRFTVKGLELDENTKVLDLVNERLVHQFQVEYDETMLSVMDVLPRFDSFVKSINPKIEQYLEGDK